MEAVAYLLIVAGIASAVWAAVRSEAGDSQSTIDNRQSPIVRTGPGGDFTRDRWA